MKCEQLDWQGSVFGRNKVAIAVDCDSFEQSLRLVETFKSFILKEAEPSPVLDDIAWYCHPTDTGSMT